MIRFDLECDPKLWEEIVEEFGENAMALNCAWEKLQVKVNTIPSIMKAWILGHCDKCELVGPRKYREEIQNIIMEGYKKYW